MNTCPIEHCPCKCKIQQSEQDKSDSKVVNSRINLIPTGSATPAKFQEASFKIKNLFTVY